MTTNEKIDEYVKPTKLCDCNNAKLKEKAKEITQRPETGIHQFLRWLPEKVIKWDNLYWHTPSEVIHRHAPVGEIDVHEYNTISWADLERDPSAWIGNPMQTISYKLLKELEALVKGIGDEALVRLWRYL